MVAVSIAGLVLFYLVLLIGLLIIPLSFPGTWVMLGAAALYALVANLYPGGVEWVALLIIAGLAGLGELIEFGVRIAGSKLAKVSTGAIVAAIVGGLIGVLLGFPIFLIGSLIGLLIGVFAGAFLYAFLFERQSVGGSLKVALATTTSQVVALFAKTCIGIGIIVYLTVILF